MTRRRLLTAAVLTLCAMGTAALWLAYHPGWLDRLRMSVQERIEHRMTRALFVGGQLETFFGPMVEEIQPLGSDFLAGMGTEVVLLTAGEDATLRIVSRLAIGGFVHRIAVGPDAAYVAAGNQGLVSLAHSGRSGLARLDTDRTPGYALSVAYHPPYLFVSCKDGGGLTIFGIEDPLHPEPIAQYASGENVSGSLSTPRGLFVSIQDRLDVVGIRDIRSPTRIASLPLPGSGSNRFQRDPLPRSPAMKDPYLYLAHGLDGIDVLDVSEPSHPKLLHTLSVEGFHDSIVVIGDTAYVGFRHNHPRRLDLSNPADPVWGDSLEEYGVPVPAPDGRLYLVNATKGAAVVDPASLDGPRTVGRFRPPAAVNDLVVAGSFLYAAEGSGGVGVYTLDNPAAPRRLHTIEPSAHGHTRRLIGIDHELWVADTVGGLHGFTMARTGQLRRLPDAYDDLHCWSLARNGDDLVLADSHRGVAILHRTSEGRTLASAEGGEGFTAEVATHRDFAYAAGIGKGILIYSLRGAPRLVATVEPSSASPPHGFGALRNLSRSWPFLMPSASSDGDLPDGLIRTLASGLVAPTSLLVHEAWLFVGDALGSLTVFDIADPLHPRPAHTVDLHHPVLHLHRDGAELWAATGPGGIYRMDLANPSRPRISEHYPTPAPALATAVSKDVLYIAHGEQGITALRVRPPLTGDDFPPSP